MSDDDVDDDNNKTCLDKDSKTKIPCGVNCKTGLIIPIWKGGGPGGYHYTLTDRIGRGVLYVVFMVYLFIGVSIVCDKFMDSIEMITSSEKEISVKDPTTGETQVLVVKVRVHVQINNYFHIDEAIFLILSITLFRRRFGRHLFQVI